MFCSVKEMEEIVDAQKQTKKRSRPKPLASGPGITPLGDHFVCAYTGRVIPRAIVPSCIPKLAVANVPCAVAWIRENVEPENHDVLLKALAEEYEQPLANLASPPPRAQLLDFGGNMPYNMWIGDLELWDTFTDQKGISVSEWKQKSKRGGGGLKKGKGTNARVVFEAGMYSIKPGKANSFKRVNALDGAVEKGDKERLTPAAALRSVTTFAAKHATSGESDYTCIGASSLENGWSAVALVPANGAFGPTEGDELVNNLATQILQRKCYGPAVVTFTKKYTQNI